MGSVSTYNDAFFKTMLDELAVYTNADELSSIHFTETINKVYKKNKSTKPTKTTRHNTRKLAPTVDLTDPKIINTTGYTKHLLVIVTAHTPPIQGDIHLLQSLIWITEQYTTEHFHQANIADPYKPLY